MQKRLAFLLPLLLALSACDTVNDTWEDVWGSDAQPIATSGMATTTGCPQVAVVRDLSVYQNPPAATENSLILTARMGNIRGGCSLHEAVTVDVMVEELDNLSDWKMEKLMVVSMVGMLGTPSAEKLVDMWDVD